MKQQTKDTTALLVSGLIFVFVNVMINIWIAAIVCLLMLIFYFEREYIRRKLKWD